jgi:hypothetical protein
VLCPGSRYNGLKTDMGKRLKSKGCSFKCTLKMKMGRIRDNVIKHFLLCEGCLYMTKYSGFPLAKSTAFL